MPGKWSQYRFYARDARFRPYMPQTALLNQQTLSSYLGRFGSVYVKPNLQHTGKGVMKAWRQNNRYHYVFVRGKVQSFETVQEMYRHMRRRFGSKPHIVQKTIDLAKVGGRRYDIRVMMLRGGTGAWTYCGMLAKVAGQGSIVTNVRRGGGYAITVDQALSRSLNLSTDQIQAMKSRLIRLSHAICSRFNSYKYTSQIGIDFAMDSSGRLWIIEVNFDFPSHDLFALLKDKTFYWKIKRTVRAYRSRGKKRR
ncbi:YheC/YheD family protein [Paenibacillus cremeus]|nr:YheC/YheD family protein [Paenibacillus cremeus]